MIRAAVAERSGRFDKLLSVGETLLHVHSGDATMVFAIDHLLQTWDDMAIAVFAQLHHDPATAHFVSDGAGGA